MHLNLGNINVNKPAGPDEIHPDTLRSLANLLGGPTCMFHKATVQQGYFPQDLKAAALLSMHTDAPCGRNYEIENQ